MRRQARIARQQARIAALRRYCPPLPLGGDMLPRAKLARGMFATVGALRLLGIDRQRYRRETQRGILFAFRIGPLYALEVPHWHVGPEADYLVEMTS